MDNARQKLMSKQGLEPIFNTLYLEKYLIKPPNHILELNPGVKHNIVKLLLEQSTWKNVLNWSLNL